MPLFPTAGAFKRVVLTAATAPIVTRTLRPLARRHAVIFMLHRMRDDELGVPGHDLAALRMVLQHLRRERYAILSLHDILARLASGEPMGDRAVAFTLDDGYRDQALRAGSVFAEFDAPATVFVTSGFLDELLWLWWDRLAFAFRRTTLNQLSLEMRGEPVVYRWTTAAQRDASCEDLIARCKHVSDPEKHATIDRTAEQLEVALPRAAPPEYAPMTWGQMRVAERRGMSFGPHTVTHPILSRTSDEQSRYELSESWRRLCEEAVAPLPVFCYPNGGSDDFGTRELATLRSIGIRGAVVGKAGYADEEHYRSADGGPYRVRRFSFPDELAGAVQIVNGVEKVKRLLRRED